jgi:hypothetical protein
MADSSPSPKLAFVDQKPDRSDVDLEKGVSETNSDFEAATIVPEDSLPVTRDGSGSDSEKKGDETSNEKDPNIVSWDGPNDPLNPMNWPMKKKWLNIAVLSVMTLITFVRPRAPCFVLCPRLTLKTDLWAPPCLRQASPGFLTSSMKNLLPPPPSSCPFTSSASPSVLSSWPQ